jgi:hypothetical protein
MSYFNGFDESNYDRNSDSGNASLTVWPTLDLYYENGQDNATLPDGERTLPMLIRQRVPDERYINIYSTLSGPDLILVKKVEETQRNRIETKYIATIVVLGLFVCLAIAVCVFRWRFGAGSQRMMRLRQSQRAKVVSLPNARARTTASPEPTPMPPAHLVDQPVQRSISPMVTGQSAKVPTEPLPPYTSSPNDEPPKYTV